MVKHVTVLEFLPEMKADAVLIKKLQSLPNVTIHTNAQTTEITGAAGKVYTAKDIAEDPHYRARDMLLTQETRDGYSVEVPGIVPKLSATPGTIRSSAPHLGDDTDAVLAEAGLTAEQIALLRSKGVIQ